jgi:hypothetical protein
VWQLGTGRPSQLVLQCCASVPLLAAAGVVLRRLYPATSPALRCLHTPRPHTNGHRLAPLDHVKNLYKDAESLLPRDRQITRKQDLIRAVRAMSPVAANGRRAGSSAAGGGAPAASSGAGLPTVDLGLGGPIINDAVDNTARTLLELEQAVNLHSKKYNDLKRAAADKGRRLEQLQVRT